MYHIAPAALTVDPNIKVAKPVLTDAELNQIRRYGDKLLVEGGQPGRIGFNQYSELHEDKRRCLGGWLPFPHDDPETRWIYDMMGEALQSANAEAWQYDISGFENQLHYVRYDGHPIEPGHFTWHQDKGDDWRRPQRKLAIVLLLSNPSEYEGGAFQVFDGSDRTIKMQEKGSMYVFPSFLQHRVCPVTAGERRSLIGWACGPRFR